MKLTAFGFVDLAETFLKDALSSTPVGGGSWGFQRSMNFSERTGSLQVVLTNSSGIAKPKASIQARQTGSGRDYSIQGWTELSDLDKRTAFVLKASNPVGVEEEVFDIVDRLLAGIPERDQSVTFERPAPPPKPAFEPLIPAIQKAPEEPSAESSDSSQAFIDALLSGDAKSPSESESAAESSESAQALVDSLMAPNPSEQPPATEEQINAISTETPTEESPAEEEAVPKAKATKPKKTAK
jgi:hypothetical protein